MNTLKFVKACLLIVALFVMVTFSCCDGPDPDPCEDKQPVTADFKIYEAHQFNHPEEYELLDTDTVSSGFVSFEAVEEDATYEWTLGAETITSKSFQRHSFPRGEKIEVSLKVTKTPNASCFPDDDGEDTKTRFFYTTPNFYCDSRLNGSYEGYDEKNPTEKRTISIETCADYPVPIGEKNLRIINLVPGCNTFYFNTYIPGYKQMYFGANGQPECLNPSGIAELSKVTGDSIKITYTIKASPTDQTKISKTFIGIRK